MGASSSGSTTTMGAPRRPVRADRN
jgi:hypothetical protein